MPSKTVTFARSGADWSVGAKKAKDHKLSFPVGSGKHDIAFHIGTPTGRFKFDTDDPIWVQEGNDCPQCASSHPDITVRECSDHHLVVDNANESAATLRYQLNVIEKTTNRAIPIDPIIENGGKGIL